MNKTIKTGLEATFDIDLISSSVSGSYSGSVLTNLNVDSQLLNDSGSPINWGIENNPVYDSGWSLTLTADDTNQSYQDGNILITADEIEPFFIVITFDSDGMVIRSETNTIDLEFIDSDLDQIFDGISLSNVTVVAQVYDSPGTPSNWSLSNVPVYVSGTSWTLEIPASESNQTLAFGSILIMADEIEPLQVNVTFGGSVRSSSGVVNSFYFNLW